ncbi:heme-binding protein 2 [Hyalella azteca]|uniref:Heme-binding protein 2 n=1 Tax=Hyalella azteca TaxID=294128 RepID=A0A8B7P8M5_HYAAZ|nr:heme-binding protein 2 [Hyalella azteca]
MTALSSSWFPQLLLLLATARSGAPASILDVFGSSVSSLVTTQEEAPHTIVRRGPGYEVRKYPSQWWVCRRHAGSLSATAQQAAFLALFDYLAGHNNQSLVMDMAVPASVEAPGMVDQANEMNEANEAEDLNEIDEVNEVDAPEREAPAEGEMTTFEACFYPGKRQQANPPQPSNPRLYLKLRPKMVVYTRQFGGYADTEEEWRAETRALSAFLRDAGQLVDKQRVYWNAYDSPIKFWARRNEVWLPARD